MTTKVKVSAYRDQIKNVRDAYASLTGCLHAEVPAELEKAKNAVKELKAMNCPRSTVDDKFKAAVVIEHAQFIISMRSDDYWGARANGQSKRKAQ